MSDQIEIGMGNSHIFLSGCSNEIDISAQQDYVVDSPRLREIIVIGRPVGSNCGFGNIESSEESDTSCISSD